MTLIHIGMIFETKREYFSCVKYVEVAYFFTSFSSKGTIIIVFLKNDMLERHFLKHGEKCVSRNCVFKQENASILCAKEIKKCFEDD